LPDENVPPDFKGVISITIETSKNPLNGEERIKVSVGEGDEKNSKGMKILQKAVSKAHYSQSGKDLIVFHIKE